MITIGVAADLGGSTDWIGWPQANAVQLAISQTNGAGGVEIDGVPHTLTLVTADSACDATQAVTAANSLVNAGVVAVVGHTCSPASYTAQPIYNAAGIPMVLASPTSPGLTKQGYTTTFRVVSKDDTTGNLMATYFRHWLGLDTAAIIEWDFYWGSSSPDAFQDTFTSQGGTITSRRTVTSTADYTATLSAIQPENPDAIFWSDINGNSAGFLNRTTHNLGMSNVIMGWDAMGGDLDAYAVAAGPAAEGSYAITSMTTDQMPGYDDFNAAYQATGFPYYGAEAQAWGAFAYDAAQIIIAAIGRADSVGLTAIRDGIANTTDYVGVVGTYEGFDTNGDVIPQWAWLKRYHDGQWMILRPSRVYLPLVLNDF